MLIMKPEFYWKYTVRKEDTYITFCFMFHEQLITHCLFLYIGIFIKVGNVPTNLTVLWPPDKFQKLLMTRNFELL